MKKMVCITMAAIFVPLLILLYLKNAQVVGKQGFENIGVAFIILAAVGALIQAVRHNSGSYGMAMISLLIIAAIIHYEHNYAFAGIVTAISPFAILMIQGASTAERDRMDAHKAIIEINERQKRNGG